MDILGQCTKKLFCSFQDTNVRPLSMVSIKHNANRLQFLIILKKYLPLTYGLQFGIT